MAILLDNLIENALHYAAGELTVEWGKADGEGWLAVLDEGPGLAAGEENELFERFARGSAGRDHARDRPRPRDRADARAPLEGTSGAREPRRRRRSGGGTVSERMKRRLAILALALLGLLCAAGVGVAAYLVSRDSVAVPVTRLQPAPWELAPVRSQPRRKTTTNTAPAPPPPAAEPGDDHGGRRGRGGGGSGHGGGGGGGGND